MVPLSTKNRKGNPTAAMQGTRLLSGATRRPTVTQEIVTLLEGFDQTRWRLPSRDADRCRVLELCVGLATALYRLLVTGEKEERKKSILRKKDKILSTEGHCSALLMPLLTRAVKCFRNLQCDVRFGYDDEGFQIMIQSTIEIFHRKEFHTKQSSRNS